MPEQPNEKFYHHPKKRKLRDIQQDLRTSGHAGTKTGRDEGIEGVREQASKQASEEGIGARESEFHAPASGGPQTPPSSNPHAHSAIPTPQSTIPIPHSVREPIQNPKSKIQSSAALYAELHCLSNFSFLRGASHPDELVQQAAALGYSAVAITDRNSLAGVVRAHEAAKQHGIHLLIGAEITPVDAPPIVLLCPDRSAYARLARLITVGRLRCQKGECRIELADIAEHAAGLIGIITEDAKGEAEQGAREEGIGARESEPQSQANAPTSEPRAQASGPPHTASPPLTLAHSALRTPQSAMEITQNATPAFARYRSIFPPGDLFLAADLDHREPDEARINHLQKISNETGIPLVATNHVHYHAPERRYLQDVLTCIREKCTLAEAGSRLFANAERHLRPLDEIARRYRGHEALLTRSMEIAQRCTFSLNELKYEYPHELCPEGKTPTEFLAELTWRGAADRYKDQRHEDTKARGRGGTKARRHEDAKARRHGDTEAQRHEGTKVRGRGGTRTRGHAATDRRSDKVIEQQGGEGTDHPLAPGSPSPSVPPSLRASVPPSIRTLIETELALIAELKYEHYFLTVWDLCRFARERGILCQGRGSAANSAVCYCLGVTAVDPARIDLLFERFISRERNEPPDIDVDFEHERREEVFQYIYEKYGRERAAIAAEVITYRPRSAIRDVGKALGLSLDRIDAIAKTVDWWHREGVPEESLRAAGLDPHDRTIQMLIRLVGQLLGFPRHLSQHVGGFVITESPLCEIVPLENGAMPGRTFIEWDKDDIDALGILKVDCLALGMLTAISKAFGLLRDRGSEGVREQGKERTREPRYGEVLLSCLTNGDNDATEQHVPRLDRLAESDRSLQADISPHRRNAREGSIWADRTDATRCRFNTEQHRRRQCTADDSGLSQIPDRCSGLTGRAGDADLDRNRTANALVSRCDDGSSSGSAPNSAGTDRQRAEAWSSWQSVAAPTSGGNDPHSSSPDSSLPVRLSPSLPHSLDPFLPLSLADIPPEDPAVYDMICTADTLGVFQIESRAQMSMLPRLRPRNFYDLVIEVAIVRPGPIQGGMVHPFLRRRNGEEPVTYPSDAVKTVLQKTLGVPLFQEQVMRLAVVAAGFTPGEADQLRRAMAAWRRGGHIEKFQIKLMKGMLASGYTPQFAEQIFNQIKGFGEYGFPESHAASFALLVYVSAWIKKYHPAAFAGALINSQPMGFYAPAQIIRDAITHGVTVRPIDILASDWDCSLEHDEGTQAQRHEGGEGVRERGSEGVREPGSQGARKEGQRSDEISEHEAQASVSPSEHESQTSKCESEPRAQASGQSQTPLSTTPSDHSAIRNPQAAMERIQNAPALRLGFRLIRGLSEEKIQGILAARKAILDNLSSLSPPPCLLSSLSPSIPSSLTPSSPPCLLRSLASSLFSHPAVSRDALIRLAAADAFRSLGLSRREALWQILSLDESPGPLFAGLIPDEPPAHLPQMSLDETVVQDYDMFGLSLNAHPIGLLREDLAALRVKTTDTLKNAKHRSRTAVAGLVTHRQRPSTAKGIVFITIEDETGHANLIVHPRVWDRDQRIARTQIAFIVEGVVERHGEVIHVVVNRFREISESLEAYRTKSRDFH